MSASEGRMNDRTVKFMASMGLIVVTLVWGSAFVVMKNSMDAITPTYLLAYRFTIASAGLVIIFWRRVRAMTRLDISCGALLGFFLFISYFFQTYGLKYTTASKNAFITTLYVIIVPFLHWFFNKVKPTANNIAAALIAVAGLALLSLKGDLSVNTGDFLTFLCGFFFALHMVFVDRYTLCFDPIKLTVVQMIFCSVFSWLVAALFEGPCDLGVFGAPGILTSVLYLGIISSMLCFLLQMIGQKYLSPGTTSILLSFESVFGLVFSVIFLKETVTLRMLAGCALMFTAAILAELSPGGKKSAVSGPAGKISGENEAAAKGISAAER